MSIISIAAVGEAAASDQSFKAIALFGSVGMVISLCLMIAGIDLGPALS